MRDLWDKLEKYFEKNNPEVFGRNINAPVTDEQIKSAQADINKEAGKQVAFPKDLLDCLKIHNGQKGHKNDLIFTNWALMSLEQMVAKHSGEVADLDDDESGNGIQADSGVKAVKFNPCWIPIAAQSHMASFVFIDLDPASGGTKGQVVIADHDSGDDIVYRVVAKSFKQWFTDMVNARAQNKDGKIDGFDSSPTLESFSNKGTVGMKHRTSQQSVVTLANAAELVRNIAQGVMGNEVADTFNGSPLTRGTLYNLSQTKFQGAVAKYIPVGGN